jgi:aspartyl-tRNA(Asn)/glutamyl-tRNA(Gln) amidotransferase subunit C
VKLSPEQVRHVAKLARLQLSADEEARFGSQLSGVLSHMEQLNALDVSAVQPMTHALAEPTPYRDDVPVPSLGGERVVANAPAHVGTGVAVPRIIE